MRRPATALLATVASVALTSVLLATPASAGTRLPETVPLPAGFQPEGITSGPGTTFYVGSRTTGAIYRGDLRTGEGAVLVPGATGEAAIGTEYDPATGRLWVAGGNSGEITVYDAASGTLLGSWTPGGTGFLNDLTVTPDAVYVTDSNVAQLIVVPTPGGVLPDQAQKLPLTGDIAFTPGVINANGIEDARGGQVLLVVQSNTGLLFAVDPETGVATTVDLGGASLSNGDGLLLQGSTLYAVRNRLNEIVRIRLHLAPGAPSGQVVDTLTDPDFDVPTTVTQAAGRLFAVNARFGVASPEAASYDVVLVDRSRD
ncbi:superoxide dismutase [Goekera deserti]|uniref:superoxide dismutase n=1 Tax=Goekera deserti TaxID=2497753 RepID=UPI001878B508|nr:superoxide dismutase [Goekera deserti]